jgi:hypothetical protein
MSSPRFRHLPNLTPPTRRVGGLLCPLDMWEEFCAHGGGGRSVMSMARLSAGAGYRYLLRHTAAGDTARSQSTSLVDYYAATGYPAGRWLGSGLTGLNDGAGIPAGSVVTEQALAALYAGRDPSSGKPLGRPFPTYASVDGKARRHAVAGFDLTFTVPKSVSARPPLRSRSCTTTSSPTGSEPSFRGGVRFSV